MNVARMTRTGCPVWNRNPHAVVRCRTVTRKTKKKKKRKKETNVFQAENFYAAFRLVANLRIVWRFQDGWNCASVFRCLSFLSLTTLSSLFACAWKWFKSRWTCQGIIWLRTLSDFVVGRVWEMRKNRVSRQMRGNKFQKRRQERVE